MFLLQARVARHFAESGERLFDMTPKCHFLQHLAIMAKGTQPESNVVLCRRRYDATCSDFGTKFLQRSACHTCDGQDDSQISPSLEAAVPKAGSCVKKLFGRIGCSHGSVGSSKACENFKVAVF